MTDSRASTVDVGDYVVDLEDLEPDLGIVIHTPPATISNWTITDPETGEEKPVSEQNPNYDEDEPVVLVAYVESGLEERWPEWRSEYPDGLYDGVIENSVAFYSFPETRVHEAPDDQVAEVLAGN